MSALLEKQEELIKKVKWKYLIVLDSCRYDYFSQVCKLPGKLKKVISPAFEGKGAPTSVWYRNVFRERYDDIIHISSHPRVNSKMEVEGFEGRKHFYKVIDLWDIEWNDEIGTVLPESVTRRALKTISKFSEKRFIIHYMQPHTPYISLGPPATKKGRTPQTRISISRKLRNFLVAKARLLIGDMEAVKLMELLRLPPLSPMDDALRKVGKEGVKEAYKKNLEIVIESVEKLVKDLEGKTIITSDHGELLGENGRFGHDFAARKELVEVPWFEVE